MKHRLLIANYGEVVIVPDTAADTDRQADIQIYTGC